MCQLIRIICLQNTYELITRLLLLLAFTHNGSATLTTCNTNELAFLARAQSHCCKQDRNIAKYHIFLSPYIFLKTKKKNPTQLLL